jgi:hypothetical protein
VTVLRAEFPNIFLPAAAAAVEPLERLVVEAVTAALVITEDQAAALPAGPAVRQQQRELEYQV